ncbi:MAG TPA: hypothetical protein VMJ32_04590 [Pirellulales bacterium]|nr:hypothetical protein [Pirellulales bacterium]
MTQKRNNQITIDEIIARSLIVLFVHGALCFVPAKRVEICLDTNSEIATIRPGFGWKWKSLLSSAATRKETAASLSDQRRLERIPVRRERPWNRRNAAFTAEQGKEALRHAGKYFQRWRH